VTDRGHTFHFHFKGV